MELERLSVGRLNFRLQVCVIKINSNSSLFLSNRYRFLSLFCYNFTIVQPEVYQESNEILLYVGQTAYFKCMSSQNIYDNKNYRVTWLKNNSPMKIDESRMLIMPSGALEIDEVTTQDRGTYQCNVSYENFHRVSSKTNLNIRSPSGNPESFALPSFVVIPTTQTAKESDSVILDCASNGNPKPKITWLRDGVDIDFKYVNFSLTFFHGIHNFRRVH
jgi:neogenin